MSLTARRRVRDKVSPGLSASLIAGPLVSRVSPPLRVRHRDGSIRHNRVIMPLVPRRSSRAGHHDVDTLDAIDVDSDLAHPLSACTSGGGTMGARRCPRCGLGHRGRTPWIAATSPREWLIATSTTRMEGVTARALGYPPLPKQTRQLMRPAPSLDPGHGARLEGVDAKQTMLVVRRDEQPQDTPGNGGRRDTAAPMAARDRYLDHTVRCSRRDCQEPTRRRASDNRSTGVVRDQNRDH